jgi:hypothetical protein
MDAFMFESLVEYATGALYVLLLVALTVALIFLFVRTRNPGFIWLAIAIVVWPVISTIAYNLVLHDALARPPAGWIHPSFLERHLLSVGSVVQEMYLAIKTVGVLLFSVAVVYLRRLATPKAMRTY